MAKFLGGLMKTSAWTYIFYYSLVYIVLAIIYGIAQKQYICIEMEGFECNFNETKFIGFLTIIAYILTPIVAIFGFISWRDQKRYELGYDYAEKSLDILDNIYK